MMLLLDTHIFLWFITGDERLSQEFRKAIEDADAAYLSVVSVWEVTVKFHLGKLPLPQPPNPWLFEQREHHGVESLSLNERAVSRLSDLPNHHKDPFDRLLVCQAIEEQLMLVTVDPIVERYPARFLASA
jgi:PIN domain nuclease of toxin-antitoxin system